MRRAGRQRPYLVGELVGKSCVRCGNSSTHQWNACADGLYRPICKSCDVELNRVVLTFMRDPDLSRKIRNYRRRYV